ncbi:hypothetical protein chiPu_0033944, partial [Chiloscyllium punctatum]|nr:hypothetical protein [Chiloscyllium punctatum]
PPPPKRRVFSQYPVVNDELPHRILSGRVTVKGAVRRFSRTSAIFEDGSEEEVDAVVLATGYSPELPFRLEPPVSTAAGGGRLPAYRQVFPLVAPGDGAHPQPGSLALIGLVEPVGPIMAVSEMQARWAARVFK